MKRFHYTVDNDGFKRFNCSDQPCLIECVYNRGGCVKRHYAGVIPRNYAKHGCPGYSRPLPEDSPDLIRLNDIRLKMKRPRITNSQLTIEELLG